MSRWGKGGVLVSQQIRQMIDASRISSSIGMDLHEHVQPSSIVFPVGEIAWEMKGVVLPRDGEKVVDIIEKFKVPHVKPLDLRNGTILEKGRTYIIKAGVKLRLDKGLLAEASPKSSIGRVDLHTRVVTDCSSKFDTIPDGYEGDVYLYVVSNSFRIYIETGIALTQVLFRVGNPALDPLETKMASEVHNFFRNRSGKVTSARVDPTVPGALMTVDLQNHDVVGYFAKDTHTPLFLNRKDNPTSEFWEEIPKPKDGALHMPQGKFGIFVTKEHVSFPPFVPSRLLDSRKEAKQMEPGYSGVMMIYDPSAGEFRAHYAGFFDPGWGCNFKKVIGDDGKESFVRVKGKLWGAGVLEIRSFEKDRIIRDGDPICRIVYERLMDIPDFLYATTGSGSNYGIQTGPRLSKFFK